MTTPEVSGLHHVAILVPDLEEATHWYSRVLGAHRINRLDHHDPHGELFATVLSVPGMPGVLQLRLGNLPPGYDPLTLEVRDEEALQAWVSHLDQIGEAHSGILTKRTGLGVELTTPHGLLLRFYTAPRGGFDEVAFDE